MAFTLMEVVIGLSIVVILAAVAVPALGGYLDQKTVESAADQLATVRDALYGGANNFQSTMGANSRRLSQLTTAIAKSNPLYTNSCGAQFGNEASKWTDAGPFVNFPIDRIAGMATPIGVAEDTLTRNPNSATAGTLRITFINNVETRYAEQLDSYVDGANGNTTGIVQWVLPASNGLVTLHYFITINNKC